MIKALDVMNFLMDEVRQDTTLRELEELSVTIVKIVEDHNQPSLADRLYPNSDKLRP